MKCERPIGDEEEENIQEQKEEIKNEGIIIEEVTECVPMLKRGKTTGHDNTRAEMLQNIGENEFEMSTELYNKMWKEERIPKDREVGIVILLFKKGDNSNCSNYRRITLLSVVLKVYKRIL